MGTRASNISLVLVALEQPQLNQTRILLMKFIKEDRRVTLDAIATKLEIGHNAVQGMIGNLGYRKICARWLPRLLTEDHKVWPWKNWEHEVGCSPSPSVQSWSGIFRLPSLWFCEESDERTAGTEFYGKGIFKLLERWEKCVQGNGDYVNKIRRCLWTSMSTWFLHKNKFQFIKIVAHYFWYELRIFLKYLHIIKQPNIILL